jgi:hypothetical protein
MITKCPKCERQDNLRVNIPILEVKPNEPLDSTLREVYCVTETKCECPDCDLKVHYCHWTGYWNPLTGAITEKE